MSCEKECSQKGKITREQLIAIQRQKVVIGQKAYVKALKGTIKAIKAVKPEDRLAYAHAIATLVGALSGSLKGWQNWMNFDTMNQITLEEMEKIYPLMREAVTKWLQVDVEITEDKTKEIEAALEKSTKKHKKRKKKTKTYIT